MSREYFMDSGKAISRRDELRSQGYHVVYGREGPQHILDIKSPQTKEDRMKQLMSRIPESKRRQIEKQIEQVKAKENEESSSQAQMAAEHLFHKQLPKPIKNVVTEQIAKAEQSKAGAMPIYKKTIDPAIYTYSSGAYQQMMQSKVSESMDRYKAVDVNQSYQLSSGEIISGQKLKQIRKEETEAINKEYISAMKLKPYHTIKQTDEGFVIYKDLEAKAKYDWHKLSWQEQAGKAFYVGVTRWPSTIWEGVEWVGAVGAETITGGFEAVGIVPKGKTEQVKKHHRIQGQKDDFVKNLVVEESILWDKAKKGDYGAVVVDAAFSPAMIEVYTLGVTKGVSSVARPLAKGLIRGAARTGAKTYSAISKIIPEEKLVSKLPSFGKKVVSTDVVSRSYQWAAKGYKFGYKTMSKSTTPIRKTVTTGFITTDKIKTRFIQGGGKKLSRVWMSPAQYDDAARSLSKKIGSKTVKPYASRSTGEIIEWKERTKLKGVFSKRLETVTKTKRIGITKRPLPPEIAGKGSFIQGKTTAGITLKNVDDVATKSAWYDDVIKMQRQGFTQERPIIIGTKKTPTGIVKQTRGTYLQVYEGFGQGPLSIPEKKWHYVALGKDKLKTGILKAKEATASLRLKTSSVYKPAASSYKQKYVSSLILPGVSTTAVEGLASYSFLKHVVPKRKIQPDSVQVYNVKTKSYSPMVAKKVVTGQVTNPVIIQTQKNEFGLTPATIKGQAVSPVYVQGFKYAQATDTVQTPVYKQKQIVQPVTSSMTMFAPVTRRVHSYSPSVPLIIPPVRGGGGRPGGYGEDLLGKKYKFRMFDLHKGVKLPKLRF